MLLSRPKGQPEAVPMRQPQGGQGARRLLWAPPRRGRAWLLAAA
jgi:hypothetical protein